MQPRVRELLEETTGAGGLIVALTGAGISAESGIPTFRGKEGYWTVGSREYHPQELATHDAFVRMPERVWEWYLHRRGVCRAAAPNPGHAALARLDRALGERVRLITQNVDGLHLRAGSAPARTYQIHGNIDFMRCADECSPPERIPESIGAKARGEALTEAEVAALVCARCGARCRPHVLWFDECYDEPRFRFESSLAAAAAAALLLVIGTSASTTLPWHVVKLAAERGAAIIDVNTAENPFGEIATSLARGAAERGTAATLLPEMIGVLLGD